jgi:hypothetical protein
MAPPTDLAKAVKEAAYVAVGLGVLGFQRAQVRRRELASQLQDQRPELEEQLAGVRAQVVELGRELERRLQPALVDAGERLEPLLDDIRRAAADAGEQLKARLRDAESGPGPSPTSSTATAEPDQTE